MFEWFNQGGKIMWILLGISLLSWCLIIERFITLFREWNKVKLLCKKMDTLNFNFLKIDDFLSENRSSFSSVLSEINDKKNLKKEENIVLTKTKMKEEANKLQKGITILEIAATVSPLLGLLGTVIGMVEVFSVIAKVGVGDPAMLSIGISKALNTTVFGLIVAIPSLVAFSIYERKIENWVRVTEKYAVILVSELYKNK